MRQRWIQTWKPARKGTVLTMKAAETQGKGSVLPESRCSRCMAAAACRYRPRGRQSAAAVGVSVKLAALIRVWNAEHACDRKAFGGGKARSERPIKRTFKGAYSY